MPTKTNVIFKLNKKQAVEEVLTVKFEGEFVVRSTKSDQWGSGGATALQNAKDFASSFADGTVDFEDDYGATLTSFTATKQ